MIPIINGILILQLCNIFIAIYIVIKVNQLADYIMVGILLGGVCIEEISVLVSLLNTACFYFIKWVYKKGYR
jgi:hypothetical protein